MLQNMIMRMCYIPIWYIMNSPNNHFRITKKLKVSVPALAPLV